MEARKLKEAEACMAAGAKCTKTGFFGKWKADWESAASEYERAATSFRVAKALPQAVDAYQQAARAHEQMECAYMAAKHLESGAHLLRELGRADESASLYERASALHHGDGALVQAGEALVKAARVLDGKDDARAGALVIRACAIVEEEEDAGKLRACVETYKQAVALLLRSQRCVDAAELLSKQAALHARLQQGHGVARCELSVVVAHLAANDFDGAEAAYASALARGGGDFAGSDEAASAEALLRAFSCQSEEQLAAAVGGQPFTYLENQVVRLARALTLRSADVPVSKLTTAAAALSVGPRAAGAAGAAGAGDFGEVAPEEDAIDEDDLT